MPSLTSIPVPIQNITDVLNRSAKRVIEFTQPLPTNNTEHFSGSIQLLYILALIVIVSTVFLGCISKPSRPPVRHNQRTQRRQRSTDQPRSTTYTNDTTSATHITPPYHTNRPNQILLQEVSDNTLDHLQQYRGPRNFRLPTFEATTYIGQNVHPEHSFSIDSTILERHGQHPLYNHSFVDRQQSDRYHVNISTPVSNTINLTIFRVINGASTNTIDNNLY